MQISVAVSIPDGLDEPVTECLNCTGIGWVCENHRDQPWGGMSVSRLACECGAGAPCQICNRETADAHYTQKIQRLEAVLWMAEEWYEHIGSAQMEAWKHKRDLAAAAAQ